MISGDAAVGNDLDGESGMLPIISYRNHFQDVYSNSSLLKSIGRDEEDSANLNFMTHQHQQLTEENRNFTSAANEKKTPGLGVDASGKLKSSS